MMETIFHLGALSLMTWAQGPMPWWSFPCYGLGIVIGKGLIWALT